MFASAHQTGSQGVEILSPSGTGKDTGKYVAFQGSVVRNYERQIKGYCYEMKRSGPTTCIQCPASSRDSLGIIQSLLVLQLYCSEAAKVSVEVIVLCTKGQRHRLHFSSVFKAMESNLLHAQIPWDWTGVPTGQWTEVRLDLAWATSYCFSGTVFASLAGVCIKPVLRVRKIFSLPAAAGVSDVVTPVALAFPTGVAHTVATFASEMAAQRSTVPMKTAAIPVNTSKGSPSATPSLGVHGVAFGSSAHRNLVPKSHSRPRAVEAQPRKMSAAVQGTVYESLPASGAALEEVPEPPPAAPRTVAEAPPVPPSREQARPMETREVEDLALIHTNVESGQQQSRAGWVEGQTLETTVMKRFCSMDDSLCDDDDNDNDVNDVKEADHSNNSGAPASVAEQRQPAPVAGSFLATEPLREQGQGQAAESGEGTKHEVDRIAELERSLHEATQGLSLAEQQFLEEFSDGCIDDVEQEQEQD